MSIHIEQLLNNQGVCCTKKGIEALADATEIYNKDFKRRERQFCMLLQNNDEMSRYIGLQMIAKVDLEYLFDSGYIELVENAIQAQCPYMSETQSFEDLIQEQIFDQQFVQIEVINNQYEFSTVCQQELETDLISSQAADYDDIDPVLRFVSGNF